MACSKRKWFRPQADKNAPAQCWRYPPVASALLVPVPPDLRNPQGGAAMQSVSLRPAVVDTDDCGEYAPKLSALS